GGPREKEGRKRNTALCAGTFAVRGTQDRPGNRRCLPPSTSSIISSLSWITIRSKASGALTRSLILALSSTNGMHLAGRCAKSTATTWMRSRALLRACHFHQAGLVASWRTPLRGKESAIWRTRYPGIIARHAVNCSSRRWLSWSVHEDRIHRGSVRVGEAGPTHRAHYRRFGFQRN